MTRMHVLALALALTALGGVASASAQEGGMPGTVFEVPDPGGPIYQAEDDQEVLSDMHIFLSRGFRELDWDAHSRLAAEIARDLAVPDYVARTGNPAPEHPVIEVASAMITKGPFNDLVVLSRLPGDCGEDGCLFQVYVLEDEKGNWRKTLEFRATGMALKDGPDLSTVIAAVGDEEIPSRVIHWDGERFIGG